MARTTSTPLTSSMTISLLVAFLKEHGNSCDAILAGEGLTGSDLASPDLQASVGTLAHLWSLAAAVDPAIGLHLIKLYRANQMHFVTHLASRCATAGQAIEHWCRYARVVCETDSMSLHVEGDSASLRYENLAPQYDLHSLAEHYFAMFTHYLLRFVGSPVRIREVQFSHDPLGYRPQFNSIFGQGVPIFFGRTSNTLTFDAALLQTSLQARDDYLQKVLVQSAEARLARIETPSSITAQAKAAARARLVGGQAMELAGIAQDLGLHPRALRSRLSAEQTTFRQVVDDLRQAFAREHLDRGLSATEVAYLVGFSEPAGFQRACLRWFGCYAGEYRDRQINQSPFGPTHSYRPG